MLNIDLATGTPKQFPEIKVVYSEFKGSIAYGQPGEAGPVKVKSDPNDKKIKRSIFGTSFEMREVRMDPDVQILMEIKGMDGVGGEVGLGWTWLFPF